MGFFNGLVQLHQFIWSLESQSQQRLAWKDAAQARTARAQAEARAEAQLNAMMSANPSGQLGRSELGGTDTLKKGGLL